jgi:hypothetical protein
MRNQGIKSSRFLKAEIRGQHGIQCSYLQYHSFIINLIQMSSNHSDISTSPFSSGNQNRQFMDLLTCKPRSLERKRNSAVFFLTLQ